MTNFVELRKGEVQHSPTPIGPGPPAGESYPEGYYVSYVQSDRLVVFYIRNVIAQEGAHTREKPGCSLEGGGSKGARLND
jgi:hypothetical protein